MVKHNDPFWDYVEKLDDGPFKCAFCGYKFAAGTSVSRIKWHLSGVKGRGVKICENVPQDVQDAARAAIDGPPEKKHKTIAGSSNNEVTNAISTSILQESSEVRHVEMAEQGEGFPEQGESLSQRGESLPDQGEALPEQGEAFPQQGGGLSLGVLAWIDSITYKDIELMSKELMLDAPAIRPRTEQMQQDCEGRTSRLYLRTEDNVLENPTMGLMQHFQRRSTPERLSVNQVEPQEDLPQPTDLLCLGLGRHYDQLCPPSVDNDVIMNDVENMVRYSSTEGLEHNGDESRGYAFPTKKLVGGEFEKNKNAIWSWLMNGEASSSMGIYGMGGVGKTALLTHIHNLLLNTRASFNHVSWITVSQDFSISKLQNLIAKEFHLDLSSEHNEKKRAAKLMRELSTKPQWVLILDDLWNYFDFDEVGIPIRLKGCKLILSTRLLGVCQRMLCQKMIKVRPLSSNEAWTLFTEKLGHDTTLPREVEQIAKSVARECAGLPLGIITMAGTMRGVVDVCEWRNVLEELVESKVRQDDMEPEVFRILRFSYTHLKDSSLQQCFLYCSLFPEDFEIYRNDLIGYLIDEGIIRRMKSTQVEVDKGHAMLNKLLNVCLLERGTNFGDEFVRMHDLIRDMAVQIQRENSQVIVRAGAQLKELPDVEEWTENLVRVSLSVNQIEEIPSSHSPRCPNLSTLLLSSNNLQFIADSFFEQLHGLKILDLSHTNIEKLPGSVCNLASLISLLLSHCKELRHVPSLKNLRALKRLDLRETALEKIPQDMEWLSNLRYLRLNGCGQMEFPIGILPKLSHLQVFVIDEFVDGEYVPVTVKGKEVACLKKLENLQCHFEGHSDFVEYLKYRDEPQSLSTYQIFVGQLDENDNRRMMDEFRRNKSVGLGNFSINRDGDFQVMFPNDIEELVIDNCNDARSLCDVSLLNYATELEFIRIWDCNSMESLVSSSWFCCASSPLPASDMFSSLKSFTCYGCRSIKKLFPLILLPNLVNLEVIKVDCCEKMEEIIATRDEEGIMGEEGSFYSITEINLPKLRILRLGYLSELKSICSANLICNSLKEIEVYNCPNLKRMPISLPMLDIGHLSPPPSLNKIYIKPKEWWESVEWEDPKSKDVLLPFVWFWDRTEFGPLPLAENFL